MKRNILNMVGCAVCMATVFAATQASAEVDQVACVGTLADLGAVVTQAHKALADATESGDAIAVADAKKRAEAAEAALVSGKSAYEQVVAALGLGDEEAAEAAVAELVGALEAAINALAGVFPQEGGETPVVGGKPAVDVPNIYKKLWESDGTKELKESIFNLYLDASGSLDGKDSDATPE